MHTVGTIKKFSPCRFYNCNNYSVFLDLEQRHYRTAAGALFKDLIQSSLKLIERLPLTSISFGSGPKSFQFHCQECAASISSSCCSGTITQPSCQSTQSKKTMEKAKSIRAVHDSHQTIHQKERFRRFCGRNSPFHNGLLCCFRGKKRVGILKNLDTIDFPQHEEIHMWYKADVMAILCSCQRRNQVCIVQILLAIRTAPWDHKQLLCGLEYPRDGFN